MEIEPLKIPAFMRKKAFVSKESAHFLKPSPVPSSPAPSKSDRSRFRLFSPTPVPTPSAPVQPRRRITFSAPILIPSMPTPVARHCLFANDAARQQSLPIDVDHQVTKPVAPRVVKPEPVFTPVGVVTYYLDKIKVVIVKLDADLQVGDRLVLNGENGPFKQKLSSMQIDRQNVETAGRGDEVGIKVSKKAIVGEMVYIAK